ncbi:MAG: ATP-dependent zinc metalloprotease FtsH [Chitinivibrionales bacterium]|nr:ATP-dependent zinc metalloprotease FtsH [Chitinivibrionales bacterium]
MPQKQDTPRQQDSQPQGGQKKSPFLAHPLLWIFLFLATGVFVTNLVSTPNRAEIAYTTFKQQVKKGNVTKITVEGNKITGQFASPYTPDGQAQEGEDVQGFSHFATTKPAFEDPGLVEILEANNVTIDAVEQQRSWFFDMLILLLPWVLIIGVFMYINRRMQGQMKNMMGNRSGGGLFGIGRSKAKRYRKSVGGVTYEDVAGLDNAKQDLREIVEYLKAPQRFRELGASIPKGVLLVGAPGTGKTLLARSTAGEANVPFFSISGSEFIEMFVGVGASRVRDMFNQAKQESPAIIFIDELDSVGRSRGTGVGGGHDEREQTLNQILSEMDGFEPSESVIVMAATNRPDVLDAALTRPGRFDRQIALDLPHKEARKMILEVHTRKVPLEDNVDLDIIAARTVGFSGADLHNLVNEAALLAGRKGKHKVSEAEFGEATDRVMLGSEREEMLNEDERRIVAYHEAGHALVAEMLALTDPVQKVTIIPRGRSLGATEQVPKTDRHNFSRSYLLDRIAVMLGGRAAEQLALGDVSNGGAHDLKNATGLVRQMVCQWGMSERLGPVTFRAGENHPFLGKELSQPRDYSENTAKLIDDEIRAIIHEMEDRAEAVLTRHRHSLEALAKALLKYETLGREGIDNVLYGQQGTEQHKPRKEESMTEVQGVMG